MCLPLTPCVQISCRQSSCRSRVLSSLCIISALQLTFLLVVEEDNSIVNNFITSDGIRWIKLWMVFYYIYFYLYIDISYKWRYKKLPIIITLKWWVGTISVYGWKTIPSWTCTAYNGNSRIYWSDFISILYHFFTLHNSFSLTKHP